MVQIQRKQVLKLILVCIGLFASSIIYCQEPDKELKGNFYGDVFLNGNYNLEKNYASFRLNRLHFGYKYNLSENLFFNGMIESALEDYEPIATGGDYDGITNLFEFCLGFNFDKVEGKFGLIGTQLNQQQEKLWLNRNIDKVFADKYGYAPTNDFGGLIIYKPLDVLKIDVAIVNGEGHKSLQADSAFRVATGVTLKLIDKVTARIYTDFMNISDTLQTNLIAILGYSSDALSGGFEFNLQNNAYGLNNYTRSGISAYASYNITKKYTLLARYDNVKSNKPDGFSDNWNIMNDGSLIIIGLNYKLLDNVTTSINYRNWTATDSNDDNLSLLFLDLAINF